MKWWKKPEDTINRFGRIHERDRWTDTAWRHGQGLYA